MQWSVVKKVGKNKQLTYQTNDHVAQEVVIICTLVAHIGSTVCNHIAYRKCIKCTRLLRKFTPIPQISKRTRYVLQMEKLGLGRDS